MRQVVLIVGLLCLSSASAEVYRAGEDEQGDSSNQVAPGADVGALISNDRTDILHVDLEEDGDHLLVHLGLATLPAGTSGYLYRVVLEVGGASYFTCWSVQYTGGTEDATQENVLGCSRFTSGTQVGPATRASGIVAADNTITWPVPRSEIDGAGLAGVESIFADTWFRGVSNCCVGSTTNSQYMWNRADRGPDEGVFDVVVAPAPAGELRVNLTAAAGRTAAAPGSQALFVINATSTLAANITFQADTPWNITGLEPWNGTGNLSRTVLVSVPEDANGTHAFFVHAMVDGNATASIELTVDVDPAALPPGNTGTGNETSQDVLDDAGEATPLPAWPALAVLAALARRR